MRLSDGHLLGGRVRYAQPLDGYRTGIEPVLLAASVPAQPGQRVLEAGTGAGAGLLCLAARVRGISGVGVEIDPAMADLARQNLRDNGCHAIDIVTADIAAASLGRFDHVFANPPWHDPRGTASPSPARRAAKQARIGGLESWISALLPMLAPAGTLSLILPPAQLARARAGLGALGSIRTWTLRPKPGRPAKLAIIQAPPLGGDPHATEIILHQASGSFTTEIEAVLRGAAALRRLTQE